jgi:hypothetical protein
VVADRIAIPASGGTVTVTKADSPLDGLRITIPAGTYTGGTTWTVAEVASSQPVVPAGMRRLGVTFRIQNNQGYGTVPFVLEIPVRGGDAANTVAFMHDPASGTFELLPLLGAGDGTISVATRHVSAAQMATPGNMSGFRAGLMAGSASAGAPFGQVEIVVLEVDPLILGGSTASSFVPGTHDWEFPNQGSWLEPYGYCTGSTLTALYYHYTESAAPLHGRFLRPGALWRENAQGIRMASVVQRTMNWPAAQQVIADLIRTAEASGIGRARTQALALAATIRLTGLPQQVAVFAPDLKDGHAVIGYASDAGSFRIADPNTPGVGKSIQFAGDDWVPFQFATSASADAATYVEAFVIGATALVPLTSFASHWAAFHDSTAGDGQFAPYQLEYLDPADTVWVAFPDTIVTASDSLVLRATCAACPAVGPYDAGLAMVNLYSATGDSRGSSFFTPKEGVALGLDPGTETVGIVTRAFAGDGGEIVNGYIDFTRVPIKRVEFDLTADPVEADIGEDVTFTVEHNGLFRSGTKLVWDFGDGTPEQTVTSGATAKHAYETGGTYVVWGLLKRTNNTIIAKDSVVVIAGGVDAWRGQNIVREIGTVEGLLPQLWSFRNAIVQQMDLPRDNFFVRREIPGTGLEQVVFLVVQRGTGTNLTQVPPSPGSHQLEWVVAEVPAGTLLGGTGPISGAGTVFWQGVPLSYTFEATFAGDRMDATLTAEHSSRDDNGNPMFRLRKWQVDARPFVAGP